MTLVDSFNVLYCNGPKYFSIVRPLYLNFSMTTANMLALENLWNLTRKASKSRQQNYVCKI